RAGRGGSGRPGRATVIVVSSPASVPRYVVRRGFSGGADAKLNVAPSTTPSTIGCSDVGLTTDPVSVDPCWFRTKTVSRNVPSPFATRETHRAVRSGAATAL